MDGVYGFFGFFGFFGNCFIGDLLQKRATGRIECTAESSFWLLTEMEYTEMSASKKKKKHEKKGKAVEFPLLSPREILHPYQDVAQFERARGGVLSMLAADQSPTQLPNKIKLPGKVAGPGDVDDFLMGVYHETFHPALVSVPADQTDEGPCELINGSRLKDLTVTQVGKSHHNMSTRTCIFKNVC